MQVIRIGTVRRWGFSLGSVLLLTMVVLLISVSIGALASFQLSSAQQGQASKDCEMLADSVINMAVSKLQASPSPTWGNPGDTMTFMPDPADTSRNATIIFGAAATPASSTDLVAVTGAPYTASLAWNNAAVPPSYCRLVATAQSHSLTRRVEVMVHAPAYPYALSWGGALNVVGGPLTVAGAGDLADYVAATGSPFPMAASIAYVGSSAISTPLAVTGNVYYSDNGTLAANPATQVDGVIREVSNVALPSPNPSAMASSAAVNAVSGGFGALPPGGCCNPCPAPPAGTYLVNGLTMASLALSNSVLVSAGTSNVVHISTLSLHRSLLYVQGDVIIDNPIVGAGGVGGGDGMIVSGGSVSIQGMPAPAQGAEVEILAQGPVTVSGPPCGTSYFQGLIYTGDAANGAGDGLTASYMNLAGTFISQGQVTLNHSVIWGLTHMADLLCSVWPGMTPPFAPFNFHAAPDLYQVQSVSSGAFLGVNIYSAITAVGMPAYNYLVSAGAGPAPLATASLAPNLGIAVGGLYFDPSIQRFTTGGHTEFLDISLATPTATPRAVIDQQAQALGFTTDDIIAQMRTAQIIASNQANNLLAAQELASGAITNPALQSTGILPSLVDLDLRIYVPGAPPFPLVVSAWKVDH